MTEFVGYTPGAGEQIAVDIIPGGKVQRVKVMLGSDGVDGGVVSANNPLPVEPSGNEQILFMLSQIMTRLESAGIVDSAQRQRVTIDAITANLALGSVTTVNNVGAQTALAGMDREMWIGESQQTFGATILPLLKFG